MEIKTKNLPKSKIELEIELSKEEFEKFFTQATKELGRNIEIAGFRKGNAPKEMLLAKMGSENVLSEAAKLAVTDCYKNTILKQGLEPISQPHIEILKLPALHRNEVSGAGAPKNPFVFRANFFILQEIELPDYKKISASTKKKPISISESEIEETLTFFQKSRPKLTLVSRPAKKDDFVEIEFSCPLIENRKIQKDAFILGKGNLVPGFEDELNGMQAGQKKKFSLQFPQEHFQKELADKKMDFEVEMKKVHEVEFLEINDDFARQLGNFENLDSLRKSIRSGVKLEKEMAEKQRIRLEILEKIEKEYVFEIPVVLIEQEKQRMLDEAKQIAQRDLKLSFEDYLKRVKKTEKEFMDDLGKESKKRVKNFLILRAIAKKEKIEVSESEVKDGVNEALRHYSDAKVAKQDIDPEKLNEYTKERIRNEKTLAKLESFALKN